VALSLPHLAAARLELALPAILIRAASDGRLCPGVVGVDVCTLRANRTRVEVVAAGSRCSTVNLRRRVRCVLLIRTASGRHLPSDGRPLVAAGWHRFAGYSGS
jgi:hypothetical protein